MYHWIQHHLVLPESQTEPARVPLTTSGERMLTMLGAMLKAKVSIAIITLFSVAVGFAQTRPGPPLPSNPSFRLSITVTDENGVAVPAALVQLRRVSQPGTLRCETDFAGRCSLPSPASQTYELRIEKPGFYATVVPDVHPEAAPNLDVTLSHQQEVHEVVNVQEVAPEIDPAQVASREQLTAMDIVDIPYPSTHDFRNVLNVIPGVIQDSTGQPHVAGGETYQTLTLLDGFNVTQPANGLLLVHVSTERSTV